MKNNTQPKLHISLSKEHSKYQSDVADAFKGLDVSFDGGLMRFSAQEMAMQVILNLGLGILSSAMWDVIKVGVKKLHKKFNTARVTLRDSDSIMYTVKPDLSVSVLAVPDRMKEFVHIKNIDDLIAHLKSQSRQIANDNWRLIPVNNVFTFVKSYAFSRDNLTNGVLTNNKIGNIHYGDIHATYSSENIDLSKIEIPIIKNSNFKPREEDLLKDGDLIMADASEDYDGIGVTVSVHGIGKNKVVGGLHTFVLRDIKGITDEYYRQYIFNNLQIRNSLQKVANGISVYGISKTALSKILLPIPSLLEQKRIVMILETWDRVIENLTKKIEYKKRIKNNLIPNVVLGKTRLPGFSEPWKEFCISDFCSSFSELNLSDKAYEVLSCTKYDGLVRSLEYFDRKVYGNDLTKYKIVPRFCFAYATNHIEEGSIGYQDLMDFGLVSPMYTVFKTHNVNNVFLFKLLKTPKIIFEYQRRMTASVERRGGLRWSEFSKIKLKLPSIKEQNAIASLIESSDKEIRELEKKLKIIKEQKKYLLNNLITGTIRTPETLSAKLTK